MYPWNSCGVLAVYWQECKEDRKFWCYFYFSCCHVRQQSNEWGRIHSPETAWNLKLSWTWNTNFLLSELRHPWSVFTGKEKTAEKLQDNWSVMNLSLMQIIPMTQHLGVANLPSADDSGSPGLAPSREHASLRPCEEWCVQGRIALKGRKRA